MSLSYDLIRQQLTEKFGDKVFNFEEPYGMLSFEVSKELNVETLRFLFNELGFQFLTDLTVVHYPAYVGRELAVVYHMHNLVENIRLRFKSFIPVSKPDINTATVVFESA